MPRLHDDLALAAVALAAAGREHVDAGCLGGLEEAAVVLHLDGDVVREEGDLVLHAKNYNRVHRQGQGISTGEI